jgi:hypothetical protein
MYLLVCFALLTMSAPVQRELSEPVDVYHHFVEVLESMPYAEGVKLRGIKLDDETLVLNVSREIMNYGGNANEQALINYLLEAASNVKGINCLTLLVEGELVPLPEGRVVEEYPLSLLTREMEALYPGRRHKAYSVRRTYLFPFQ